MSRRKQQHLNTSEAALWRMTRPGLRKSEKLSQVRLTSSPSANIAVGNWWDSFMRQTCQKHMCCNIPSGVKIRTSILGNANEEEAESTTTPFQETTGGSTLESSFETMVQEAVSEELSKELASTESGSTLTTKGLETGETETLPFEPVDLEETTQPTVARYEDLTVECLPEGIQADPP